MEMLDPQYSGDGILSTELMRSEWNWLYEYN